MGGERFSLLCSDTLDGIFHKAVAGIPTFFEAFHEFVIFLKENAPASDEAIRGGRTGGMMPYSTITVTGVVILEEATPSFP